jgi:hypothetical protein
MVHGIPFLKGNIAAPVADLDVTLQSGNMSDGPSELEPNLSRRHSSSRLLFEWTIRELGPLLLRLFPVAFVDLGVVGDRG